ncbi:MAG: hypothetical protein Q8K86_07360 [Candidatus Nanopelagicaceae bacterium]|nr:hypothetical protein [Candidatus Nanopelagicaceae bacterium]
MFEDPTIFDEATIRELIRAAREVVLHKESQLHPKEIKERRALMEMRRSSHALLIGMENGSIDLHRVLIAAKPIIPLKVVETFIIREWGDPSKIVGSATYCCREMTVDWLIDVLQKHRPRHFLIKMLAHTFKYEQDRNILQMANGCHNFLQDLHIFDFNVSQIAETLDPDQMTQIYGYMKLTGSSEAAKRKFEDFLGSEGSDEIKRIVLGSNASDWCERFVH